MFIQAQVMISIATSNEVSYGKMRYVMVSFDSFDAYMFPFGPEQIIAVGCVKPYSPEKVLDVATGALQGTEPRRVL